MGEGSSLYKKNIMKNFIDVYHLDNIDWAKAKDQGYEGGFIKVSDGLGDYAD